jgi:hypothetical protein
MSSSWWHSASCYRPPDNRDSIYLDNLQTYLAKILAHKGAHIWLGGYFNLFGNDWQHEKYEPIYRIVMKKMENGFCLCFQLLQYMFYLDHSECTKGKT